MTLPLNGCWAKIGRADEHFEVLQAEIASAARQIEAIHFRQEFHPDTSTIEVLVEGVPELPVRWSLLAADFCQNLRAALNYIAWELAKWSLDHRGEQREPAPATQFPIAYRHWRGLTDRQLAQIRDLHPDHVARIEALQPNSGTHFAGLPEDFLRTIESPEALTTHHPLAKLALLSNEDKHRLLLTAVVSPGDTSFGPYPPSDCRIDNTNVFLLTTLENGAKWAEFQVTVTGPEPKVEVNDQIEVFVAFGTRRCNLADLWSMRTEVTMIASEFVRAF